jgi:hypothetical protein
LFGKNLTLFVQTPLDISIANAHADCATLLRLAIHATREHPNNALADESFAHALKQFSEDVEKIRDPSGGMFNPLLLGSNLAIHLSAY